MPHFSIPSLSFFVHCLHVSLDHPHTCGLIAMCGLIYEVATLYMRGLNTCKLECGLFIVASPSTGY